MKNKEIILSKIAEIMSRKGFLKRNNSEFKARLKCAGLGEYFNRYSNLLLPYCYVQKDGKTYENCNVEYDVFLGIDSIFTELFQSEKHGEILSLLTELTKSICVPQNIDDPSDDEDELKIENFRMSLAELTNLYAILGLSISLQYDRIIVTTLTSNNQNRVGEQFSVETWMKKFHSDAYDAYQAAIDSYTQGHAGACIESCRTCLVSLFSEYKGTESYAKWMRGVYTISGDNVNATLQDLTKALDKDIRKDDLADFFGENRNGKLTKTKAVYMIYSMMSDYGTHRNEGTQEVPTLDDALFSLRLTDSILFWVYARNK